MRKPNRSAVFVEKDDDRLYQRLRAVTAGDLNGEQIRTVMAGDLSLVEKLPLAAQRGVAALMAKPGGLEKMVGPALDFVPVAYLDLARMAANSVARIVDGSRRAVGTATLVSPRLLLTNNHVTPSVEAASEQIAQFRYELQVDGVPMPACEFHLDPAAFFWTSADDELDATLVAVGVKASGDGELAGFGMSSLTAARDKHAEGDFVTIIQHPEGDYKQVALRENRVIGRGKKGTTLHYGTDTLGGSSGSPVFNDQFELVALHHAGGPRNDDKLEDGRRVPAESNEGIRISAIVAALREHLDVTSDLHRPLLAEALDPPSTGPRVARGDNEAARSAPASGPGLSVQGGGTVPVRISFGDGPGAGAAAAPPAESESGLVLERNQPPDPDYASRRGYDPSFLRKDVPLPVLSKKRAKQQVGPVLDYVHFSAVQNGERKMPFFTAVNIDGKRLKSINRETGEVEAAEVWFCDPRIPDDKQLSQAVFEAQRPRIFDRGHLVRRLDPAWGSAQTAVRAANDTFHFTNCSLQVSQFNQRVSQWAGIENYVLENAKADGKRVTVFSGPVFGDDDPEYRGVGVPRAFWKILVRVDGGQLRATAFLAAQELPSNLESFDDLGRVAVFQSSVSTVAKRTGLGFGSLAKFDTRKLEGAGDVEVSSLESVEW